MASNLRRHKWRQAVLQERQKKKEMAIKMPTNKSRDERGAWLPQRTIAC